jgi:hypothetical protein
VSDYSNFGYCVLGAVVEKVTGASYASWVTSNILAPAGATGIVQGQTLWPADNEVAYYDYPNSGSGPDVFETASNAYSNPYGNYYLEAMAAHGAWVASPVDFLRFQGALDGRTGGTALLTSSSITSMLANPNVPSTNVDPATNTMTTLAASACSWYGFGWRVTYPGACTGTPSGSNTNWWHWGDLAGTEALQVHTADGWGWTAFFNSRPSDKNGDKANFEHDMDQAMWNARGGVASGGWLTTNLFDQYGAYTSWMTASQYQTTFNAAVAAGKYPSHVEGYQAAGNELFRASFVPFHSSSTSDWYSVHGLDCTTYKTFASKYASYDQASLQSYLADDGTRRYSATWVKW